jgi:hypothetical protein
MCCRFAGVLGLAALVHLLAPASVGAQPDTRAESKALARRIDKLIYERLKKDNIQPGPRAENSQLVRRLHVDLAGRIPTLVQTQDFLDNDEQSKIEDRVEELLQSPEFAANLTHFYRSLMLNADNNMQAQAFQFQFEEWLRDRLLKNTPFDKLARELIAVSPNFNNQPGIQQNGMGSNATPSAFYFANEFKPENLAGATARIFMGVKIECAQCHKHPFAKWTRQQFWEYAAFFVDANPNRGRLPKGQKQPTTPVNLREIKIPETNDVAKAKFITGEEPQWRENVATRETLAEWMTSPQNPYFAKAAVDHLWQYFFGVSLAEPVMEPTDDSPPAMPEVLEEMSQAFIASGYDLRFLARTIVLTDAYQRASVALNKDNREQIQMYAHMPVRGMMPEQLFDSFAEATVYKQDSPYDNQMRQNPFGISNSPRAQFLAKFTTQDKRIETQTSILQALFLMNGKWISERINVETNDALRTIATAATSTPRRVHSLYMLVLSRPPRPEESARLSRYIDSGGTSGDSRQAIADIYWALLNSSEFMLNH